jgi:purine-binding chemotaxis protein CheW
VTRRKADTGPAAGEAPPKRTRTPARGKAAPAAPPQDAPPAWEAPEFDRLVVFGLEGQRYALPLEAVQEIQQIVAFSEIPDGSTSVVGVINLRGDVVPAVDLRLVVGMPVREYDLQTPMVIARTGRGLVAFMVDTVEDVVEVSGADIQPPSPVYALADRLLGVCRLDDGIVFVFDVDTLLPARGGRGGTG